jgi:L-lysine exporter family protein LysE/ArgO
VQALSVSASIPFYQQLLSHPSRDRCRSLPLVLLQSISLSLLNPHAILDIVGVIGTSALNYIGLDLILFTVSCVTVSWLWFIGLTVAGTTMKRLDNQKILMNVFNKGSALFIWGTALYLLIGLIN